MRGHFWTGMRTMAVVAGLALAGVAVTTWQERTSAPEQRTSGDTLVVAVTSGISPKLAPVCYDDAMTASVLELITPGMTANDFRDGTLRSWPALASSWEWSEGGKALTYELRPDVCWEEGQRITAEDVAFTYALLGGRKATFPRSSYTELLEPEGGVTAIGPHRVRFRFVKAYDPALQLLHTGHSPMPKYVFGSMDPATICAASQGWRPKGGGRFTIARMDAEGIVLARNPAVTTHPVPRIERIVLRVHPDYAQRLNLLERGEVDLIDSIQFRDIPKVKAFGTVNVVNRGRRFLEYVAWNSKEPLFASRDVRRALTMGIDRGLIVKAVLSDGQGGVYGCEAVSSFTPDLAALKDVGIAPLAYDPAGARELLARAGWKDSDGDGVLDRDGRRFEFALLTRAGSQRASDVAVHVQDHLQKIGVSVRIETPDFTRMWELLRSRTYQAAIWGVGAPLVPDPRDGWHSGEKHVFNVSGYANAKADELMDRGALERDEAKAAAIWKELAAVIYDDQPCTFLYWFDHVAVIHRRFRDVVGSPVSLFHGVEGWWVPGAEQKRKG